MTRLTRVLRAADLHSTRTARTPCYTLLPARIAARAATVVCVLVMTVSPAKADEPIALSFRAD